MKIISITGTKGKTTIARLLDYIVRNLDFETLLVDTDGHYVNGIQKSNYADSRKYWGMVPNNCPGRFLYELKNLPEKNSLAILEAAIGSSSLFGMGYAFHDIGVMTNIFEDHITKRRIKNKGDIFKAKSFIFKKLKQDGTFIFKSDDDFLAKNLSKENISQKKIAIGKKFYNKKAAQRFLATGNVFLKLDNKKLYLVEKNKEQLLLNFEEIPFSFEGNFEPNLYNISFVVAILLSVLGKHFKSKLEKIKVLLKKYIPSEEGGRLVLLENKEEDLKMIIDFAHEKESLKQIALLAKNFCKNRVTGVLRIDPSRTNDEIKKISKYIAPFYDFIYIYDKVDGIKMKESTGKAEGKKRKIGETAREFYKSLAKQKFTQFEIVLNEERALNKAVKKSKPGDVIIFIGNGRDHKKSFNFAKKVLCKK